jgi:eukaryotic-like serine/threonine-protein kinase
MPGLRDEITKTFLRLTKRPTPIASRKGLGPNTQIGSYRIVRELGAGGMGQVYLALDSRLGRHVALKLLPLELTAEPIFLRRFQQEACTASALNHPNILTIYEFAEIAGEHIIVSEFVEGVTLRSALERNAVDLGKGLDIVIQVASALVAAHAAGVIHRDLKPTNIMIRPDGYVKVIDFGLAKLTERSARKQSPQNSWTQPGAVLGTVGYMSPEQARGEEIDERSDIWSLGVVLYEIVARHPPFEGDTDHHVIVSILDDPPRPIPDKEALPEGLAAVITRSLTKDRNHRYRSAEDLLRDLQKTIHPVRRQTGQVTPSRIANAPSRMLKNWDGQPISPHGITPFQHFREGEIGVNPVFRTGLFLPLAIVAIIAAAMSMWWWPLHGRWSVLGPHWFEIGQTERVTFDGNVLLATISPDGQQLAYVTGNSGAEILRVRDLKTRTEQSLPVAADHYAGLTFSPDSQSLLFVLRDMKRALGMLFTVAVKTVAHSPPSPVLRDIDGPVTFLPGGTSFAFKRRSENNGTNEDSILVAHASNIHQIRSIVSLPETEIWSQLAWLPREQAIAAVVYPERLGQPTQPMSSLYTIEGKLKRQFSVEGMRSLTSQASLDSGSLLVFTGRPKTTEQKQLSQLFLPTGASHAIASDMVSFDDISATADSQTLAAVRLDRRSSIWVADARDLGLARKIVPETEEFSSLTWTTDDTIIVPSGRTGSLNLSRVGNAGDVQLLASPERCLEREPTAVPGQAAVVYSSNCPAAGNDLNIWRLNTRTNERQSLTSGTNIDVQPDVSPDGKWVVYGSSISNRQSLWKVPLAGGTPAPVTDHQARSPVFSPDGSMIACELREPSSSWHVAVLSFSDGHVIREFPDVPLQSAVRWSPDGSALDYIHSREGHSEIWRQPFGGGPPHQLTHFGGEKIIFFAWNRNGTKLALVRGQEASDIVFFHRAARN